VCPQLGHDAYPSSTATNSLRACAINLDGNNEQLPTETTKKKLLNRIEQQRFNKDKIRMEEEG
jgi:hypothetical protein